MHDIEDKTQSSPKKTNLNLSERFKISDNVHASFSYNGKYTVVISKDVTLSELVLVRLLPTDLYMFNAEQKQSTTSGKYMGKSILDSYDDICYQYDSLEELLGVESKDS